MKFFLLVVACSLSVPAFAKYRGDVQVPCIAQYPSDTAPGAEGTGGHPIIYCATDIGPLIKTLSQSVGQKTNDQLGDDANVNYYQIPDGSAYYISNYGDVRTKNYPDCAEADNITWADHVMGGGKVYCRIDRKIKDKTPSKKIKLNGRGDGESIFIVNGRVRLSW